jgi:hypothetical protein
LRIQCVQARAKGVGDGAFVHKERDLRLSNGKLAAILNLPILHGIAVSKYAIFGFDPIDYIYKLFRKEIAKTHAGLSW